MRIITYLRNNYNAPQGYREIIHVGLPLVASMASTTVMQFTDRLFLSHYSMDAIAAALPSALASLTLMLTVMGICGYATVLIAQYVGSNAPQRVGVALWQGLWCAFGGGLLLAATWFIAEPLFALSGHDPVIQKLEVDYFRALAIGSIFALLGAALSSFFSGRGQTRLVMIANIVAAIINVPLDYIMIFGAFGFPSLGITGAGIATSLGWVFTFLFLCLFVFTKENEKIYAVRSAWHCDWEMLKRLLRYGLPSGFNMFIELIGSTWFVFEVGALGRVPLAASNIAFSINSLVFTPMLGLNMGTAALVGQAMGRGKPHEAETITKHTLHLAFSYMVPVCMTFILFPETLLSLFAPGDMPEVDFAPVRSVGVILLFYIAIYSLVDASSIIYFGALKGAGDTIGILYILIGCLTVFLILPIIVMKQMDWVSLHRFWIAFTVYVIMLALASHLRFKQRKWHRIRVVETALKNPTSDASKQ